LPLVAAKRRKNAAPGASRGKTLHHDLGHPPLVTGVRRCATIEPLLKPGPWRKLVPVENKLKAAGRRENMADFLSKTRTPGVVANIAEYVVMLFVAVMTGVSTLRLLGILP
jgi:hypothetical protein